LPRGGSSQTKSTSWYLCRPSNQNKKRPISTFTMGYVYFRNTDMLRDTCSTLCKHKNITSDVRTGKKCSSQ
jgi:hypothetical protein